MLQVGATGIEEEKEEEEEDPPSPYHPITIRSILILSTHLKITKNLGPGLD
jgi:hypothetical protein